MSRLSLAGAASLVGAPVVAALAALVTATESDDAAKVVAAYTDHHGAMIGGAVLEVVSIVLFMAGIAWLAAALAPRSRNLAVAGGVLGLAGSLLVLFEDGLTAARAPVVSALGQAQATPVVDHLGSSVAAGLEPLATLQAVGILLLAIASVKAGAARWAAAALALGSIVNTVGFGSGSKAPIVAGFVLMVVGAVPLVRTLAGRGPAVAGAPVTA